MDVALLLEWLVKSVAIVVFGIVGFAYRTLFVLAPIITVIPALVLFGVIPLGPDVELFGRRINLGLSDNINVGMLYLSAITSIAVYGVVIAGWSSNNKYALLGGIRSSAQMVSYELALGLVFVGPILTAGSMSLREIVLDQEHLWYVVVQPLGFVIFLIASLAEVNRAPFDMREGKRERPGGYQGARFTSAREA